MELIHTCYRITDVDRSVAFYEALGFEERRRMPIREEAINVFMGLPGDGDRLELTYNFGVDSYEVGTGYGHIAVAVDDLEQTLARLEEQGIEPEREPYRVREGGSLLCFVRDPGRLPRRADRPLGSLAGRRAHGGRAPDDAAVRVAKIRDRRRRAATTAMRFPARARLDTSQVEDRRGRGGGSCDGTASRRGRRRRDRDRRARRVRPPPGAQQRRRFRFGPDSVGPRRDLPQRFGRERRARTAASSAT